MRPRTKDRHLPACVFFKHGSYFLVKKGKWQRLGSDLHSALIEYARIVATPENGVPALIDKALPWILEGLKESTSTQYQACAKLLKEAFQEFRPEQVRHGDVVQVMDGFDDRKAIANRMLTVLRLTYRWALDRGIVEFDPTVSVKRYKQVSRDRLITPAEFLAIQKFAPPWLQVIMDLCYLTGQRIGDVLKIERSHLVEEGIFFEQEKTGKKLIVEWTPELREAVSKAERLPETVHSFTYLLATRGGRIRNHANVWLAFKKARTKAGIPDVTLHDIRAFAGTTADAMGLDATALLGHTDRKTTQIYLRDKAPKVVKGVRKKAG